MRGNMVNKLQKNHKLERQYKVLEMIISYHTGTAEPISSHLIARDLGLSSATIRNIMFELEEMGFLKQPHISSGRIPTDRGYRAYVDSLMELKSFSDFDNSNANNTVSSLKSDSIEDVILKGLHVCSDLTEQTCIALFPSAGIKNRLYFDGTSHLAMQPEFKDIAKIISVLRLLENKEGLLELLEEDLKENGVKAHIGSENSSLGFDECTLITANYSLDENIMGALGIIGPIRMEYKRIIPTVSYVADSISQLFSEMV